MGNTNVSCISGREHEAETIDIAAQLAAAAEEASKLGLENEKLHAENQKLQDELMQQRFHRSASSSASPCRSDRGDRDKYRVRPSRAFSAATSIDENQTPPGQSGQHNDLPSFFYPGLHTESRPKPQELFNELMKGFWPVLSRWFEGKMRNAVEPLIQAAMPAGLSIQIGERCNLGSRPLVANDITTLKYVTPGALGEEESANMRASATLDHTGDVRIDLNLSFGRVEINGITVKGTIVLELAHMVESPPWFRGLRIFFANAPKIDLSVEQKTLGLSFEWNWVKDIIINVVTNVGSRNAVLPNRLIFPIFSGIESLPMRHLSPNGVLRLQVLRAFGLAGNNARSPNPYVSVLVGDRTWRSKAASSTDPCWGNSEVYDFVVTDHKAQKVLIRVLEDDCGSYARALKASQASDLFGQKEIDITELLKGIEANNFEKTLELETGDPLVPAGKIVVKAQWRSFAKHNLEAVRDMPDTAKQWSFSSPKSSRWGLFVGLHGATGLPHAAPGTEHWAAVSIAGGREEGLPEVTLETGCVEPLPQQHTFEDATHVIAKAYNCDVDKVRAHLNGLATNGHDCNGEAPVDLLWECPFHILLDKVEACELKVRLHRPTTGTTRYPKSGGWFRWNEQDVKDLGEVVYPVANLTQCPQFTEVVSLPVRGEASSGQVRLRLQLCPLHPAGTRKRRGLSAGGTDSTSNFSQSPAPNLLGCDHDSSNLSWRSFSRRRADSVLNLASFSSEHRDEDSPTCRIANRDRLNSVMAGIDQEDSDEFSWFSCSSDEEKNMADIDEDFQLSPVDFA